MKVKKFLGQHRKWPRKWETSTNQTLALETLEQHQNPKTLLSALIDTFQSAGCDPTPEAYRFVVGGLIAAADFAAVGSVLDRIETAEKFDTPEDVLAKIIKFYGLAGRFGDAIGVFERIPNLRCVPTCVSLDSLLVVLCGTNNEGLRFVPDVLIKSRVMGVRFENSSFRILITALCRIGRVSAAVEMLNHMIRDDYGLDERACSLILSAIFEQRIELGLDGLVILEFLERIKRWGFCPSLVNYSNVIRVLVEERRGLDALKVLAMIKREGIKPDIVCYTLVLDGLVYERKYEKAEKLFDQLLVFGLVPNVNTYNAYINGLCKQNDMGRAISMISSMEVLGCKPNSTTYNHVVKALCRNGEVVRAKGVVSEMRSKGIETDSQTYRALLEGVICGGETDEACVMMEEMLEKGFCRGCSAYDEVISVLCRHEMVCEAVEMLGKMVAKDVAPGAKAWESVLSSKLSLPMAMWTSLTDLA